MSRAKKRFWSKRSRGPKRGRSQQRGAGEEGASEELTRKEGRKEEHKILAQRRQRGEELRTEVWG